MTLTANTAVPITIEYFDSGASASFEFWMKSSDGTTVPQRIVPSEWLLPKAQVLSPGWKLNVNAGGNVSYDHISPSQNGVMLYDIAGGTHEYTWNGGAYKPPLNEDGSLVRNADGTYTLQDIDGMTYVFDIDGTLISSSNANDDRTPSALKYSYQSLNGGPAHLYQIKDQVNLARNATLYYSGESTCGTAPAGYDTSAPSGMLCALKTDDQRTTYFYYISGQLARIARPGGDLTDYGYEAVQNGGVTIGYRLTGVRNGLALDAIAAGKRASDSTVNTSITYDGIGRASAIILPAPSSGATRVQKTIDYLPGADSYVDQSGNSISGYEGMTKVRVSGAS
jgi:hypothetical protein